MRHLGCWQPRGPPLGVSHLQAPRIVAERAQPSDGLERQHAPRTPAVRDDLLCRIQLGEARLKLVQGNIQCAGHMAQCVLLARTYVEHCHGSVARAFP